MLLKKEISTQKHSVKSLESELLEKEDEIIILKEKLRYYKDLFNSVPLCYQSLDKDGCIKDINNQFTEVLGYTPEEVRGRWIGNYMSEKFKSNFNTNFSEFKRTGRINAAEYEFKAKNGEIVLVELEGKVRYGVNGEVISTHCVFKDISHQKQTEKKLKENETFLNSVFEQVNIGLFVIDVEEGRRYKLIRINKVVEEFFGLKEKYIKEKYLDDIICNNEVSYDEKADVIGLCNDCCSKKRSLVKDVRYLTKEKESWWQVTMEPVKRGGEVSRIIGTLVSQDDQKKAEFAVKRSEEKWRSLVSNAPDIISLINLDFKINFINRTDYGFSTLNLVGKSIFKFYDIEDKERIESVFSKVIETGKPSVYENKFSLRDGHVWFSNHVGPLNIEGRVEGLVIVSTDITDKKKAEQALIESEERFNTFMENSPAIAFIKNEKGRLLYINKAYESFFSVHKGKWYNKKDSELWGEETAAMLRKNDMEVIKKDLPLTFQEELNFNKRKYIWLSFKFPFQNAKGEKYLGGMSIDVTELKKKEKELIIAKEKAEEADRLKSAFLANMSHEIRTPMNGIVGFAKLLNKETMPEKRRTKYINLINSNAKHLLSLISDIIDISKIESGQLVLQDEEVSLNLIMDELGELFEKERQEKQKTDLGIIVEKFFPVDNDCVSCDEIRLRQVMNNLIGNALKFTDSGIVKFGYSLYDANTLLFYVKDTGIGISRKNLSIIFERFRQERRTNKRLYGGTGLGLAISKGIVELMGGQIWAESARGKGASFYFMIPFKPLDKGSIGKEDVEKNTEKIFKGKRVLLVDDNKDNLELLKEILIDTEADIFTAESGKEAIKIARNLKKLDLVLLDIQMPGLNGYQTLPRIKKSFPDLPVIAQTAFALVEDKDKILAEGFDDYLSKPIKEERLLNVMSKHLDIVKS